MRSSRSATRSTSVTAALPWSAKRSVSAIISPRSAMSPWPSQARSAVDSPKPAALYIWTARFFAAEERTSSWRYSHLPTVTFEAERFASTVAPASAASVPGGTGVHRSSQMSVCSTKPGRWGAAISTSVPNGTRSPRSVISRARAWAAGWNQRRS